MTIRIIHTPKRKQSPLHRINSPITAGIALACFMAIAIPSYVSYAHPATDMHGNTLAEVDAFYAAQETQEETMIDVWEPML